MVGAEAVQKFQFFFDITTFQSDQPIGYIVSLFGHKKLSKLHLRGSFTSGVLPAPLFQLRKLIELHLFGLPEAAITGEFQEFIRLKRLSLTGPNGTWSRERTMPESLVQLKKLERAHLGVFPDVRAQWTERMPTVKFV